jgi:hypothetical protein
MDDNDELSLNPMKPYEILGVSPEDSLDFIKKKFNKEIMKYHPDKATVTTAKPATAAEKRVLEEYCHQLIRSYKIIKRDKTNLEDTCSRLKQDVTLDVPLNQVKAKGVPEIDKSQRFKTVDDYLTFEVPKPPKQRGILSPRDFNENFIKHKRGDTNTRAIVLRTSDGFTGYNIEQFNTFAKNVEGDTLLAQTEINWEFN